MLATQTLNLIQAATVNATHVATSSLFPRTSGTCSWSDYDSCYDIYVDCWDDDKASGEVATYDGSCYDYTCWDDHKYGKRFAYFVCPAIAFFILGLMIGSIGTQHNRRKAEQRQRQQQQQQQQQQEQQRRRQQQPINQAPAPAPAPTPASAPAPATYPPPVYVPASSNQVSSQDSSSLQQIPLDDVVVHSSAYRLPHSGREGSSGSISEEPVIVEEEDEVPKSKAYRMSEEHVW
jgi:type II secretory pathway pseudopilin PulG